VFVIKCSEVGQQIWSKKLKALFSCLQNILREDRIGDDLAILEKPDLNYICISELKHDAFDI
jgi:hypothetical protein